MEPEKKEIIVKEIEHWRRSRLLAEHYCDFLLNLYAENAADKSGGGSWLGVSSSAIAASSWKGWLFTAGIICFLILIGLNFNAFGISLQIGIGLLILLSCYVFAYRFKHDNPLAQNALIGAASLFLLLIGVYLLKLNDVAAAAAYAAYIAATSVIWLLTGLLGRMRIFHFSGWMGLVGSYAWLLHRELGQLGWLALEFSWLPLCVLFTWAGWLLHLRAKHVGGILFLVGFVVWFAPEAYGFVVPVDITKEALQLSLIGKIAIGAVILFSLRKKWIEWVT